MKHPCQFLITASLLLLSAIGVCQSPKNYRDEALLLKKTIAEHHVAPRKIDDHFSQWVFNNLLTKLDPDRLYFIKAEIKTLSAFSLKLDDELNGTAAFTFLPLLTQTFKKCLQRSEHIASQLLQAPFEFNTSEAFAADTLWAANEDALKDRWRLLAKYMSLARLLEMRNQQPAGDDKKFIQQNEATARQRAQAGMMRQIKRITNHASGFENYVGSLYLESIAASFDPHSTYFSPAAMENFIASLSSAGYYFGVVLEENEKGEVIIGQLTPGGPAWKSGALYSGDVIRQLKWEGREAMDLFGVDLEEINDLLLESNHATLELTVTNAAGVPRTVVLRKEKMEQEENIVKSFVLQGTKKVGYISLPGFYTNWGEAEGSRCANDVAKEIIKLKKENIEGLILDLRFNGGGSLHEAVAMAGIFIDAGPVGVVKDRSGESTTIKDMNRGTVYDGPLVVFVNGMSASASEFLAAALQDYRRAVVIGSRTFGKATAQDLFPLDGKNPAAEMTANLKPGIGYASVTFEKIYRITGKTAQSRGVEPHILLPDIYDAFTFREYEMPLALPYDSIFKKTYYQPLLSLPIAELKYKSEQRVTANPEFKMREQAAKVLIDAENDQKPVSLSWMDFKSQGEQQRRALEKIEKPAEIPVQVFTVSHHEFERQRIQTDPHIEEFNKAWVKKLMQDVTLAEAFHIICDLIDTTQRK